MKQQLLLLSALAFTTISHSQNVGIGTETPAEKLEVNGNIRISANAARSIAVSDAAATGISGNDLSISAGSSKPSQTYTVGGNLLLAGGRGNSAGGQAGGNIIMTTGLNFYRNGSNPSARNGDIIFRGWLNQSLISVVEYARMDGSTGNWGFGTATPTARLDVVGTVKTTGLQLTTGATAGFVLTSNASGVASWANAASLAISETDPKVGTNTTNNLSKWNGTALVSSGVFEIGGNVGIGAGSAAAKLNVNGNFKMGNQGSVLNNIIKFTIFFGTLPVNANSTTSAAVLSVTGAVKNSTVYVSPSVALPDGVSIGYAHVPTDGTVSVRFINITNAPINIPGMDYHITIIN